jgi:organic hydroperoxide reductase OsmC/OhrA
MNDVHYYKTYLKWDEGRIGTLSFETLDSVKVATPPEFPKGVPNTWSPEHLYVASINACLMTTFLAIAENSKLEFISFSCESKGKLEKVDGRFMISEVELRPEIKVNNERDKERAGRIIVKAEEHCLISNSVKTKIILSPNIIT